MRRSSSGSNELRRNERIRVSPIRLIDQNEEQVGIVEVKDALVMAQKAGLDLVEVAPSAKPSVCRIMDYGKYKYQLTKKERKSKAHRRETERKEVRIRTPKIGEHDLMIKINHAREFLERGDRVQFSLRFRGRELAHIDEGQKVFQTVINELANCSKVEQRGREGRRITMQLIPTGKQQQKPKPSPDKQAPAPADGQKPESDQAAAPASPQ